VQRDHFKWTIGGGLAADMTVFALGGSSPCCG
jgi:hypothetical protein